MGLKLTFFQRRGKDLACRADLGLQPVAGGCEQALDLGQGGCGQTAKIGKDRGIGHGLAIMRHGNAPASFCACKEVSPSHPQSNKISNTEARVNEYVAAIAEDGAASVEKVGNHGCGTRQTTG